MKHARFWDIVFDIEDWICFGEKETDTKVYRAPDTWPKSAQFFSINALDNKDRNPSQTWHSPSIGRRADVNVTKHRTFLLEFDDMPLDTQFPYIEQSGVPYSTVTFSGSKSLHVLICLERPLANRAEYDAAVRRLYAALPEVDHSAKNPSRFSRVPGALRSTNKVKQELIASVSRIPNHLFFEWLDEHAPEQARPEVSHSSISLGINKWTRYFLIHGAPPGEWNQTLFKSACDMARCGWSEDMIIERCRVITGMLDFKDMKTIKSAVTAARRSNAGALNFAD